MGQAWPPLQTWRSSICSIAPQIPATPWFLAVLRSMSLAKTCCLCKFRAMPYREILQAFKDRCRGVRSVIFCDHEGETIDFVTDFDSYHTQLLGAYHSEVI